MRHAAVLLLSALALLVAGCGQPPRYAGTAARLVPPAPGQARLYLYRDVDLVEGRAWTPVTLDGTEIGQSKPGTVFFRDVAPGPHTVAVRSARADPQAARDIVLTAGEALFVKVMPVPSRGGAQGSSRYDSYVLRVMDRGTAEQEVQDLWYGG